MARLKQSCAVAIMVLGCLAGTLADGLPGEFILTQRWRDLFAGHSPLSNPAFLNEENYKTLRYAVAPSLHGSFLMQEIGATIPIGLYQVAGLSAFTEFDGAVQEADIDASGRLIQTGEEKENDNVFAVASYAINPIMGLNAGANVSMAYQSNFGDPVYGFGVDLGASYRLLNHPLLGKHVVGLMFQNLVSSGIEYSANIKVSLLSRILEDRIHFGVDADVKDLLADAEQFGTSVISGTDVKDAAKQIEFDFNARIGTWLMRVFNAYFQIGSGYWGLAGGVNAPTINNGRDFQVMYQYMFLTDGDDASTHTVYVRAEVGKHREEIYARKMARLANILPNKLYLKAMRLYSEGKFWDAYFVFGQILARYPDFFKNDLVTYHRGSCLEFLDMRTKSLETYNSMKQTYARSNAIPLADLGIMRIHYREKKDFQVEEQFRRLNTRTVPDSVKYHAYYLMGQTHMRKGERFKAMQLFSMIPETHPEYVFAQHSIAVAYIMALNLEDAMIALENSIQAKIETPAQREIMNRSYLFLGYLFYEENSLSKSVTALRLVEKSSYYYEDALLGLAWCALKARQWSDCIAATKELARVSDKPIVKAEGALLEGYSYMMQKNYAAASGLFEPASRMLADYAPPSDDSLAEANRKNDRDRIDYDFLAGEAEKYSLTDQSSTVLATVDSLHGEQTTLFKELRAHDIFVDEFHRGTFFSRNAETVRNDIDYALAVVEKLLNKVDAVKIEKKAAEQSKDLDEEIQKLKQEMETIEADE